MTTWAWLVGALVAAAVAAAIGLPAWSASRARRTRDLNADRYLAWRGRAREARPAPGMTKAEWRRLLVAGLLALVAAFCLVGFFTYAGA